MILFPNCKINLGLNIVQRRPDGYHDLETIFYPIPLKDVLEVIPSTRFQFIPSGLKIPGDEKTNLCLKAYRLIKDKFPSLPPVEIHLYKHIPVGAGLGGGSADGAFMLRALNDRFDLGLSEDQLNSLAGQIGSDCPFFLFNKPCFARGRGDLLQTIQLDLSCYSFLLIDPRIHVETAWAFSQLAPIPPQESIKEIIQGPISGWRGQLINDFEMPVMRKYPQLENIKSKLYKARALYASMTGSGSCFYGIFEKNAIPSLSFEENFQTVIIK
jgi:4-diphosphocytidyl-2-C-methyl-D-erythritol kinase